nr:aminotransferase class V-fold PLP-dependent enzyme [Qipengyuania thermophila]
MYLDHAATTPLRPEARAAMEEGFSVWANPSSPHAEGRAARRSLEDARDRVKRALGWTGEVIFTSGASEALDIALNRARATRRVVSAVEHEAVFRAAPAAEVLPLRDGGPDEAALQALLAGGGQVLVAVQQINSETGTILSSADAAFPTATVRAAGGRVLSDCSQGAGRHALPDCDMAVVSAHKFGGPIGAGALLVRDFAMLHPVGGHERGYRQGTENLPAILGMAAALEAGGQETWATTAPERAAFADALAAYAELLGPGRQCDHIFAVAHPVLSAQAQLIRLDALGVAVSAGSACSSGTLKRSRALAGFGIAEDVAARTIRVSIGWNTTADELGRFVELWRGL